jgi:hypothetical protein
MIRIEGRIDHVIIYDLLGKKIMTKQGASSNMELDLCSLKRGMYILKGYSEGQYFTEKILKER